MALLRQGISTLERGEEHPQDIVLELQKQYGRLTDLCAGLGVSVEPLAIQPRAEERLIDDDSGIALDSLASPRDRLIPTLSIHPADDDEERQAGEDEQAMERANTEVLQMQQQMMDDQDETLNALSHAISRQRDLSLNISSELEIHHSLLEETDAALDHTESRLKRAAQKLERVGRRTARDSSATCIIVILVVVLLLLIVLFK